MIDKNLLFRAIAGASTRTTSQVTGVITSWVTSRITNLATSQVTSAITAYPEVNTWDYYSLGTRLYPDASPEALNIPDGTYTGLVGSSSWEPSVQFAATSITKTGGTFTLSVPPALPITYAFGNFYDAVNEGYDSNVYSLGGYLIHFSTYNTVTSWRTTNLTTTWTTSWVYSTRTTSFWTSAVTARTTSWITL
jgi:hypothetical protein